METAIKKKTDASLFKKNNGSKPISGMLTAPRLKTIKSTLDIRSFSLGVLTLWDSWVMVETLSTHAPCLFLKASALKSISLRLLAATLTACSFQETASSFPLAATVMAN